MKTPERASRRHGAIALMFFAAAAAVAAWRANALVEAGGGRPQDAVLIAGAGTVITIVVLVLAAMALRLPPIDDRIDRVVDRYHDTLAWLLDRRLLPIVLCGAVLTLVLIAQETVGSVALVPDTLEPERSRAATRTDFLDDAYRTATGRSRLIRLEVVGPDRQTVSGVAHRIADEVRGVPGASAVRVLNDAASKGGGVARTALDGEHMVRVEAVAVGRPQHKVLADVRRALEATPPPPGYRVSDETGTPGGLGTLALSVLALGALGLLGLALMPHARSLAESMTIMASLLITITGILAALLTIGHAVSLMSIAGALVVMGIAARDAVLLLGDARRRHRLGAVERVALIEAARHRVRPVVVVALAVAAGALPLAVGAPERVGGWSSLGVAVVGGTLTAALVTLFVTPSLRLALHDIARRSHARRVGGRVE